MALALVLNRRRQVPAEDTPGFGAIAERFRRAGELERAVALCQEGLRKYPAHLSSRVTLGWALLDLGRYDEARVELEQVLKRAPDNLAAIRGLAQLHDRTEHDDVASMQSSPSRWTPPDNMLLAPPLDEHEGLADLVADPDVPLLAVGPGPWVGLDDHTSGPAGHDDSTPLGFEPFRMPAPAAVAAAAKEPTEPIPTGQLIAQVPAAVQPDTPAISCVTEPKEAPSAPEIEWQAPAAPQADDRPWCDDGLELGRASAIAEVFTPPPPAPAPVPVLRAVPPPVRTPVAAPPQDDFVPDDGPGPWPPVLAADEPRASGQEPLRLASSWTAEADAWPPVERRPPVRCAPTDEPAAAQTASEESQPGTPRRRHLMKVLGRFGRRVDARRREVASEYVAG